MWRNVWNVYDGDQLHIFIAQVLQRDVVHVTCVWDPPTPFSWFFENPRLSHEPSIEAGKSPEWGPQTACGSVVSPMQQIWACHCVGRSEKRSCWARELINGTNLEDMVSNICQLVPCADEDCEVFFVGCLCCWWVVGVGHVSSSIVYAGNTYNISICFMFIMLQGCREIIMVSGYLPRIFTRDINIIELCLTGV